MRLHIPIQSRSQTGRVESTNLAHLRWWWWCAPPHGFRDGLLGCQQRHTFTHTHTYTCIANTIVQRTAVCGREMIVPAILVSMDALRIIDTVCSLFVVAKDESFSVEDGRCLSLSVCVRHIPKVKRVQMTEGSFHTWRREKALLCGHGQEKRDDTWRRLISLSFSRLLCEQQSSVME